LKLLTDLRQAESIWFTGKCAGCSFQRSFLRIPRPKPRLEQPL